MTKHLTKYFGELDIDKPNDWYDAEVDISSGNVAACLAFSAAARNVDTGQLHRIEEYIDNIKYHEKSIRERMQINFDEEGAAWEYVKRQIEEQDKEELEHLLKGKSQNLGGDKRILSALNLLRIVFYPEKEDILFAVLDYTLDEDLTDDLLAIKLHKDGAVSFDIES